MTNQHFKCTTCGKCCVGCVPLTLDDAFAQAGRFPLAMVWTPVRQTSRAYELTAKLGTTVQLPNRKKVAVLIAPTCYLAPSAVCPALAPDHLCAIHADKPLRCRTMPFYPYRDERDQSDLLVPRKGWDCDITPSAPLCYREKEIVEREDFDRERTALLADAPKLKMYADTMLAQNPAIMARLVKAALNPVSGSFALNFMPFLRFDKSRDKIAFAKQQHPVLLAFEQQTTDPAHNAYRTFYHDTAADLVWFTQSKGTIS